MRVYLCLDDHGRYPALVVVTAPDKDAALVKLNQYLLDNQIGGHFFTIREVDTSELAAFEFEMSSY